jgi:recombination protein RecT
MGKRANQFMASIVASAQMPALKDAEPRSVIAAAMVAATLDLPVNPTLGMAHIVAYGDKTGAKIAQFQCGYKGFIQLALRSGQYKRLNAGPLNSEAFAGYDLVGEPKLDWSEYDPVKPVGGYFCAFELLNGFTKVVYWPKKQVEEHAKRFSKAYQKGYQSSPWFSDFDGMATKTVIKNALTKWGILSVEMQKAATHDQGVQVDVDSDVKYVDAEPLNTTSENEAETTGATQQPTRPAPPPRAKKGAAAAEAAIDVTATPVKNPEKTVELEKPVVKEQEPAQAPKTEEKKPEPPKNQTPRQSLQDKEELVTVCVPDKLFALNIKLAGVDTPSVRATLKGGYIGDVYHFGGAIKNPSGDGLIPTKEWEIGTPVSLLLSGRLNSKSGTLLTEVKKITPVEAASDTAQMAIE